MDWNNDGHLDILSGCYWTDDADGGYIQMLAGNGTLNFSEAALVTNSAGLPLQNVSLSETNDASGMPDNQIKTICTQQHAVDYDGDGDWDLVVGCFGYEFFLYTNSGSNEEIQLSDSPVELSIKSPSNHSAPHLVDWDGDGDLDLLTGTADGGVLLSENVGTRREPKWSQFQELIEKATTLPHSRADAKPSGCTRVWATDWNGDGLLDLLVGDCATIVSPKEGVSHADFEQRRKENDERMAQLQERLEPIRTEFIERSTSGEGISEELQADLEEVSNEMMEVYEARSEFANSENTGFIWLYVREGVDG